MNTAQSASSRKRTVLCFSRRARSVTWDTSLTIFMEALLKDLIGFYFSAKWLWKSKAFFLAGEGSTKKLNFSLTNEMGSPCLGFKSLDALIFYETVEIGTVRALGEHAIGLLLRLSFTFLLF